MRIGAVLMASGFSHRFGRNKLLQNVEGVPMIERAFQALPAELFQRAVVVSSYPEVLEMAERQHYFPVPNPMAADGQSASIRLGLAELRDMDGVMFAVCDQPWLCRESVARLIHRFYDCPTCICALSWQKKRGNPVIFPRSLFPKLLSLRGEEGGGKVIRANIDLLRLVDTGNPKELNDVDTSGDLGED